MCEKWIFFFWKGQMKSSCAQPLFVIYRRSQKIFEWAYKYARTHCPIVASCSEQDGIECWNLENLIVIHNEFSFWLRERSTARVFIECCLAIVKRKSVNWGELGSNIMCRTLFIVRNIFVWLHFFIFMLLNWRWLCPTDQAINDDFAHVRDVVQQIELFKLSSKRFCSVFEKNSRTLFALFALLRIFFIVKLYTQWLRKKTLWNTGAHVDKKIEQLNLQPCLRLLCLLFLANKMNVVRCVQTLSAPHSTISKRIMIVWKHQNWDSAVLVKLTLVRCEISNLTFVIFTLFCSVW